MNRELKFRQFLNGEFHYWGYVDNGFISPLNNSEAQGLKSQQFTGLLDKSGKEIWEGDILRGYESDEFGSRGPYFFEVVKWDKSKAMFYLESDGQRLEMDESDYDEVIGNIYSNPELLK